MIDSQLQELLGNIDKTAERICNSRRRTKIETWERLEKETAAIRNFNRRFAADDVYIQEKLIEIETHLGYLAGKICRNGHDEQSHLCWYERARMCLEEQFNEILF